MRVRGVFRLLLVLVVVGAAAVLAGPALAACDDRGFPGEPRVAAPDAPDPPGDQPLPAVSPVGGPVPEDRSVPVPPVNPRSPVNLINVAIAFPAETLARSLRAALVDLLYDSTVEGIERVLQGPVQEMADSAAMLISYNLLASDAVVASWRAVLGAAVVLWPLVLALQVASVARGASLSSAVGMADVREAVAEWLASCIAAAASLHLIRWGDQLSWALARGLVGDPGTVIVGAVRSVLNAATIVSLSMFIPVPGLFLFLVIFFTLMLWAVPALLAVGFMARSVLLVALTVTAPLVFSISSLPPARWLGGMWLKGIGLSLLALPVSVLLLATGFRLMAPIGLSFMRVILLLGLLSLLLTLNGSLIRGVFGAVGEIASKAWGTARGIMTMAMLALTAVGLGAAAAGGVGALSGAGRWGMSGLPGGGGLSGGGAGGGGEGSSGAGTGGGGEGLPGIRSGSWSGGSVVSRVQAALASPAARLGAGTGLQALGRGMMFATRSPAARAAGAMLAEAGGLLRDAGAREVAQQAAWEERGIPQILSEIGRSGLQMDYGTAREVARELRKLAGHGGGLDAVLAGARPVMRSLAGLGDLDSLAARAGFSGPAEMIATYTRAMLASTGDVAARASLALSPEQLQAAPPELSGRIIGNLLRHSFVSTGLGARARDIPPAEEWGRVMAGVIRQYGEEFWSGPGRQLVDALRGGGDIHGVLSDLRSMVPWDHPVNSALLLMQAPFVSGQPDRSGEEKQG